MKTYKVEVSKRHNPDSHLYSHYCEVKLCWTHTYDSTRFYEDIKQRFPYPDFCLEFVCIETKEEILEKTI